MLDRTTISSAPPPFYSPPLPLLHAIPSLLISSPSFAVVLFLFLPCYILLLLSPLILISSCFISSRFLLLFGASEGNTPLGDLLLPERANCLSDLCSCLSSRTSRISTKRDLLSVEHFLIVFFCHPLTSRTSLRDLESAEHLIAFVCH